MNICGIEMSFDMSGLRLVYAGIAAFMWCFALLFSAEYMAHMHSKARYYVFMLVTFFATVGVFAAADLLSCFVFFEIMSIASYVLVIHEEDEKAMKAGELYLGVAVISGMVMLMGMFLLYDRLGTLEFSGLAAAAAAYDGGRGGLYLPAALLITGFGAKAGIFPLHIWLPKAHPVAPAPASAILSGVLTKAGVFGILSVSMGLFSGDVRWGTALLLLGTVTMLLGALLAVFSIDLKRVLACSSVSQIGFICYGTGVMCLLEGDKMLVPYTGTIWHMMNHSMIKLLLFCCAGAVMMKAHSLDLNRLRGYGRKKPLLALFFAAGALTISGVPGSSGYISKTILHEALVEYMHHLEHIGAAVMPFRIIEILFLFTGGCTFAYMLKLFICLFIEKNSDAALQAEYDGIKPWASVLSRISLAAPVAALICMGIIAGDAHFYGVKELKGSVISLVTGAAVYFIFIRRVLSVRSDDGKARLRNISAPDLDMEYVIYRPLIDGITASLAFVCGLLDRIPENIFRLLMSVLSMICRILGSLPEKICNMFIYVLTGSSFMISGSADSLTDILKSSVFRPLEPVEKRVHLSYIIKRSRIGALWETVGNDIRALAASMSVGLVSVVIGLCAFLVYLLTSL